MNKRSQHGHLVLLRGIAIMLEDHFAGISGPRSNLGNGDSGLDPATDGGVPTVVWSVEMSDQAHLMQRLQLFPEIALKSQSVPWKKKVIVFVLNMALHKITNHIIYVYAE
jgi:hypothetical protein